MNYYSVMNIICCFFCIFLILSAFLKFSFARYEENGQIITYADFDDYKHNLNKTYTKEFVETRCREAYEENNRLIRQHNEGYKSGKYSYQLRANALADLNPQQYLKRYVRLINSRRIKDADKKYEDEVVGAFKQVRESELPESFDWREKGYVTPANNQKSCGSCYAFSIGHSVSGQIFKRTGHIVELSTQQLVDCSVSIGNHGCGGGSLRNTLRYLEQSKGLMREKDYPYSATQNKCKYDPNLSVVNITTWAILPAGDENAMKIAIASIGPIAVSINASPQTFQLYSRGIYDDDTCSSSTVNHAMLAVGYTPDYWILKNWWGNNWGDDGYMKIKRNKNLCGLANYAAYAVV